ncbi:hypothetical protein E4U21_006313 [Claviceps maximensis]|nr:hypothetical protein E4U21_006313 [Claviceps maximensis]
MLQTSQIPPDSLDTACCQEPQRSVSTSLNGILRQHAGTSLFVRPIHWKDIHSELLGIRFVELPPRNTPSPESIPGSSPSHGHLRPSDPIELLSVWLTKLQTFVEWDTLFKGYDYTFSYSNYVRKVLTELWPFAFRCHCRTKQHIFYGNRMYRDVIKPQLMWNYPADCMRSNSLHDPAGLPMMCYISKRELELRRHNLYRRPTGNLNPPVRRLMRLRTKALKPANPNHDPVFVAIFLAMAQRHFYGAPSPRQRDWYPSRIPLQRPRFEDLRLRILSHDADTAEFIVYTGYITATFLDSFWSPSKAPPEEEQESSGMKIEYTRVPMWPILGLRERLGKALGQDIISPFDATKMETWQTDEVVDKVQPTKRKADNAVSQAVTKGSKKETDGVVDKSIDKVRSTKRKDNDAVCQAVTKDSKKETGDIFGKLINMVESTEQTADDAVSQAVAQAVAKSSEEETDDDEKISLISVTEKRRRLPDGSPVKVAV